MGHDYCHPDTGISKPRILHSFGRENELDPEALERLMGSIARLLDIADPSGADEDGPVALDLEPIDGRDLCGRGCSTSCGTGWGSPTRSAGSRRPQSIGRAASRRRPAERVLFALVAGRTLAPSSKLEAIGWIRDGVHIDRLAEVDHTSCCRAMDWLLDNLPALLETVFSAVADLLQLDVDLIFFDTITSYFDGTDAGLRQRDHSTDSPPDLPQVVSAWR